MNLTRAKLEQAGVPGLLAPEFDEALAGWATRYDLSPRPVYRLEDFVPLAAQVWDNEGRILDFITQQRTVETPDVVLIEGVPAVAAVSVLAKDGLILWDRLHGAICGMSVVRGALCAVYDRARAIEELVAEFEDSDEQAGFPVEMAAFFDDMVAGATLGPRTPLTLHENARPMLNNGLGWGGAKHKLS